MVAVSLKKKLKGDSSRTHEVGQSHPYRLACISLLLHLFFFFKQKTAYEIGLGIPAEPLFRSSIFVETIITLKDKVYPLTVKLHYAAYPKENVIKARY